MSIERTGVDIYADPVVGGTGFSVQSIFAAPLLSVRPTVLVC